MPYSYKQVVKVFNQVGQDEAAAKKVLKTLKENAFTVTFDNIAMALIEPDRKPTRWDKIKYMLMRLWMYRIQIAILLATLIYFH